MKLDYYSYTNKGPYKGNQDAIDINRIADDCVIACLADGVGGGLHGEEASKLATTYFVNQINITEESVTNIAKDIHWKIIELAKVNNAEGKMLTTFTGCLVKENKLYGVHCGDSRLYILRGSGIKQLTEDHTEVNMLLKSGKLSRDDATNYPRKHILNSAFGTLEDPRIDAFQFELMRNDRVLLTTDGTHGLISKLLLRDLSHQSSTVEQFGALIVSKIEEIEPTDNYSIVALEIL